MHEHKRPTLADIEGEPVCWFKTAAGIRSIGISTAYKAAGNGSLPCVKFSGRRLVVVARLREMLS